MANLTKIAERPKHLKEMKMKKTLLIVGLVVAFAVSASAATPNQFSFYAGGAVSMPNSEGFDAGWGTGWHGLAGAGYKMSPKFQLVGKLEYHNFASDLAGLPIDGGNTKITMFGTDGRYSLGLPAAPIKPYFFGGLGMASVSWDDFTGSSSLTTAINAGIPESTTKLYYNFGAGFDLTTGPAFSLFLQGRYVSVTTEGEALAFIPVTIGLKFF